jgi:hypothetical protein
VWASCLHAAVEIRTTLDLRIPYDRLRCSGFPPLFSLSATAPPLAAWLLVHADHGEAVAIRVGRQGATIAVDCPATRLGDGEPLLDLAGLQLERQLQLGGVLSLDAACISLDAGAALLLGPPGAGKTSVACALCIDGGGALVGNDLCLVARTDDGVRAQAGSRTFFFRRDAVRRNLPNLADALGEDLEGGWFAKTPVQPRALGIAIAKGPAAITGAYVIHADDRAAGLTAKRDHPQARRLLYESASRRIRASCVLFPAGADLGHSAYVPALDCERCFAQRARLIDYLIDEVGVVAVAGPARELARWIALNIERRARSCDAPGGSPGNAVPASRLP